MTNRKPFSGLAANVKADPARRAWVEQYKRAIDDGPALSAVRGDRAPIQQAEFEGIEVSRANLSWIEHEDDVYLATLRAYVTALGGTLEITAVFPDQRINLVAEQTRQDSGDQTPEEAEPAARTLGD